MMNKLNIQQKNSKKLCIVTLDPYNKGGICSMMSFVYNQSQESGFDPYLAYNLISSLRFNKKYVSFFKIMKGEKASVYPEKFNGMNGFAIERVLPEFEFFNYILNLKKWKEVISQADVFFVVGGSNNCALPLVLLKKKFSIWIATPLYEDRIDRIKKETFLRKIRDYLSLPILMYFEKLIFQKAEKILTLSHYTKNKIIQRYGISGQKIDVALFPIDFDKFYPINYSKRKNDYLLFTGRINDERKNIPLLLSAFSRVKRQYPNLKLKLIGRLPSKKLLVLTNRLKIENSVEFLGNLKREDLIPYYQNAALFVIPSFQEGLCISAIEALSCGIPVVSTRCGGPEDFIKNDYNGYLVENNNENSLVKGIIQFLNQDNEKKKKMAKNARNYILENHSYQKIWPKFLKCLN